MRIYTLESMNESLPRNIRLSHALKPFPTPVVTTAVDQSGTLIATGSADGVVKVWDISGGYITHTFRGNGRVITALHFFKLPRSSLEGTRNLHRRKKSRSRKAGGIQNKEKEDSATSFDLTEAIIHLASGDGDGELRIWSLYKRKSIASLNSHVSVVRAIAFSNDENLLLTGSRDKTMILWDAKTWDVKKIIPVLESIETLGFTKNRNLIYTGGERGRLRLWNHKTASEITKEPEGAIDKSTIMKILTNESIKFFLCVHADRSLILNSVTPLEDLETGEEPIDLLPVLRRISGTHDEIIDLAYVTPERSLLALATNVEAIRLVSVASATNEPTSYKDASYFGADVAVLEGHEDIVVCLDVDWSGYWLATGAKDNTARLWMIDRYKNSYPCVGTFIGHAESLGAVALPPKPPAVGSAAYQKPLDYPPTFLLTGSQDRTIKRWDILKPSSSKGSSPVLTALYTRKAHDKDINAISINHNSTLFGSASQDRTVKIWSIEGGELQGVLRGHRRGVWSVRFAPNDFPAVSGGSGLAGASRGLVLTGSGDKSVKIWSLSDYSCLRTLEGHTNSVLKVLWMPSIEPSDNHNISRRSPHVVSAGGDGLVKVWDASSGECACTLDNHVDRVWALAVHPETNMLVSGGGDSVVTFWKDTTASTIAATVAASTQRIEQEQELQNYIHSGSYREAITLALSLDHPARLLSLLQHVIDTHPPESGSISGLKAVDDVVGNLNDDQLLKLMQRLRDWNTNVRTAVVAQRILSVVIQIHPATKLASVRGQGWKESLEALRLYTERHYRRMEELVDESYVIEYSLREMEDVMRGETGVEQPHTNGALEINVDREIMI